MGAWSLLKNVMISKTSPAFQYFRIPELLLISKKANSYLVRMIRHKDQVTLYLHYITCCRDSKFFRPYKQIKQPKASWKIFGNRKMTRKSTKKSVILLTDKAFTELLFANGCYTTYEKLWSKQMKCVVLQYLLCGLAWRFDAQLLC